MSIKSYQTKKRPQAGRLVRFRAELIRDSGPVMADVHYSERDWYSWLGKVSDLPMGAEPAAYARQYAEEVVRELYETGQENYAHIVLNRDGTERRREVKHT